MITRRVLVGAHTSGKEFVLVLSVKLVHNI